MISDLKNLEQLEEALNRPALLIFKHSSRCMTSARILADVRGFAESHPDLPVHRVLVIEDRPVSAEIARRLGIVHESPQAILVRDGAAAWSASHQDITVEAIERALAESGQPGGVHAG